MIRLSSGREVCAAIGRASNVTLSAYTLAPGAVEQALRTAAQRGAQVYVRLEGRPCGRNADGVRHENARIVAELRHAGADAALHSRGAPLHLKAAVADGAAYLDDRNWPGHGDSIIRDTNAADMKALAAVVHGHQGRADCVAMTKHDALDGEARMLRGTRASAVAIESESFDYCAVYGAVRALALKKKSVRLLVAARDVDARSHGALARLAAIGVQVRCGTSGEKIAIAGSSAWVGSANATGGGPQTIDWGTRTRNPHSKFELLKRFEENWRAARPLSLLTADQTGRPRCASFAR